MMKGADVNARDAIGRTPLDWAREFGDEPMSAFVREHGGKTGKELKE